LPDAFLSQIMLPNGETALQRIEHEKLLAIAPADALIGACGDSIRHDASPSRTGPPFRPALSSQDRQLAPRPEAGGLFVTST
jgi:hypothetical protein